MPDSAAKYELLMLRVFFFLVEGLSLRAKGQGELVVTLTSVTCCHSWQQCSSMQLLLAPPAVGLGKKSEGKEVENL